MDTACAVAVTLISGVARLTGVEVSVLSTVRVNTGVLLLVVWGRSVLIGRVLTTGVADEEQAAIRLQMVRLKMNSLECLTVFIINHPGNIAGMIITNAGEKS